MAKNRGVIFEGPGKVEIHNIDYPTFKDPHGKPIEHGVILKVVSTNICGSDHRSQRFGAWARDSGRGDREG
jgi:glutathione-independent formaldehyde dehydrogenase